VGEIKMQTIKEFISKWEEAEIEWMKSMVSKLKDLKTSAYAFTEKEEYKGRCNNETNALYKSANKAVNDFKIENQMTEKEFDDANYLTCAGCSEKSREEIWTKIRKRVNKEAKARVLNLQSQIEKKAGKIITCNLFLNIKGEVDGTVQGEKATVNVNTILAGGYNIQRLHFRVLIKVVK
jgi:hypothetical protein